MVTANLKDEVGRYCFVVALRKSILVTVAITGLGFTFATRTPSQFNT
jgi:hypothetical protein